jgi:hypothetical protein
MKVNSINQENNNAVSMMENSKQILAIAIRHSSIYECKKAYEFLSDLIKASDKYQKSRSVIENALAQIKPEKPKKK